MRFMRWFGSTPLAVLGVIAAGGFACGSVSAKTDGGVDSAGSDSGTCTPGDVVCGTGVVNQCGQDGHWAMLESCAADCIAAPSPHCSYLEPKYLPNVCDVPASVASFDISQSGTLDTDLDGTCTGGVVPQTGAADLCVIRAKTISVALGATLKVVSSKNQNASGVGRGIALVADESLALDGILDVSADGATSGPGGGTATSGGQVNFPAGAGGAGFAQPGGAGGNASTDGGATNGGPAAMNPALLTALIGGPKASGGGGGGAALLVACRGTVSVTGIVDAGGGGGLGGDNFPLGTSAGFGGGAGGYVVLQGIHVSVTGETYANGGGGGAGGTGVTGTSAQNGQDGSRSDNLKASGGAPHTGGGAGGTGGIAGVAGANPGAGLHPPTSGDGAGGGGGSVGYFQSYTPVGIDATLTPSHSSPRFQGNGTVPTR